MRKIRLRLRSASVYLWLSEVEASHNSFRIDMYVTNYGVRELMHGYLRHTYKAKVINGEEKIS